MLTDLLVILTIILSIVAVIVVMLGRVGRQIDQAIKDDDLQNAGHRRIIEAQQQPVQYPTYVCGQEPLTEYRGAPAGLDEYGQHKHWTTHDHVDTWGQINRQALDEARRESPRSCGGGQAPPPQIIDGRWND